MLRIMCKCYFIWSNIIAVLYSVKQIVVSKNGKWRNTFRCNDNLSNFFYVGGPKENIYYHIF